MRSSLTKRQIASQHRKSLFRKGFTDCDQQRRLAIRPGSMRQHHPAARAALRGMKKSSNPVLDDRFHHDHCFSNSSVTVLPANRPGRPAQMTTQRFPA
jgi:hypothetical protein